MNELKNKVIDAMQKGIDSVINGEVESVQLYFIKPYHVEQYIESIGGTMSDDDFNTNGWEWDYWVEIELNGDTYQLSGDGYSNDYASFSKQ